MGNAKYKLFDDLSDDLLELLQIMALHKTLVKQFEVRVEVHERDQAPYHDRTEENDVQ